MCQFNAFKFYIANVRMYFFLNVHFHISLKQLKWKTILSTHFSVIVFHVLCIYMVLHSLHGHYTIYKCILHLHIQAYMVWLHPKALKHVEHDIDTTLTHHKHSQEYQWWSKSKKVKFSKNCERKWRILWNILKYFMKSSILIHYLRTCVEASP
jgi:hypothetical protein